MAAEAGFLASARYGPDAGLKEVAHGGTLGSPVLKHFGMDLEFLLRREPAWREILEGILFQPGDIVEHGEEAEEEAGFS
jgi:hypothetical protein